MFFSSVSDVLCAISDAANMNGCLVLHTLSNTATRLPQGEKRPCMISYGSCPLCFQYRWPIYHKVLPHSLHLCWVFFLSFFSFLFFFFEKSSHVSHKWCSFQRTAHRPSTNYIWITNNSQKIYLKQIVSNRGGIAVHTTNYTLI